MADETVKTEQQKQEELTAPVYVKVRSKKEPGFNRAGRYWLSTDTYAKTTEAIARTLEAEKMLVVNRIEAGDVPEDRRATVEAGATAEMSDEELRDQLVSAEFPSLTSSPGGHTVRRTPPPIPPPTYEGEQKRGEKAAPKGEDAEPQSPLLNKDDQPPKENESQKETILGGLLGHSNDKKKK